MTAAPTLDEYTLVLLRRPPDAPDLPDGDLARLQADHIAFLDELRSAGTTLVSGPAEDARDPSLRGLCFYRLPDAETRAIAAGDPLVRAGRLVVDTVKWLVPTGTLPTM